jgi:asparagine synthase (glutamine-hydrolysing)
MCGICGTVGIEQPGLIEAMADAIAHRGPDDFGTFVDGDVSLGHRRLSIIDIAGGHQPMSTPDGALTIVFNGEIYNFAELRASLEARGARFETSSDTEVLLRLVERDGPDAVRRLNGMFAFAIFDRRSRELVLGRDRLGIKPLYYAALPGRFLFASEVKSLLRYEDLPRDLNPHAVQDYLGLRYVPGDVTMLRAVRRLPPAHLLRYRGGALSVERYWSPPLEPESPRRSEGEYLEELAELLERSVRRRLISDVPFGAYLSGGLDSSLIVALMSRLADEPVRSFSVGFDYEHDELSQARETAERLGCEHREVQCRAQDVTLLPEVVYHGDDPLGDAIAIPMYQLAREAKKHVTVILTGEGGDEIFAGYLFHKVMWAAHLYGRALPRGVRERVVQPLLGALPARLLNVAFRYPAYLGDRGKRKALDYLDVLNSGDLELGYRHLISLFDRRDTASLYTPDFAERLTEPHPWAGPVETGGSAFDRMLRLQLHHWLPDNMLMRQDKMSMASAIEGRVPFLDHELVEFAFRLPRQLRLRGLVGKYLPRRVADRLLPRSTSRRRKMPFYVPIENYFQQAAFVEMMDDLLSDDSVRRRGLFRPEAVAALRRSMHQSEFLLVKQAFSLMVLELWFRTFVDAGGRR